MPSRAPLLAIVLASTVLASCAASASSGPVASSASGASAETVTREVTLRDGVVHLVVERDADGDAEWASYVADRASAYLPAAERYFDRSFYAVAEGFFPGMPRPWTVRIHGRRQVMLGNVHIGAYNNSSGVFGPDREIVVEYSRAKLGDPALVLHELTHFFVLGGPAALVPGARAGARDEAGSAWFIEGIASLAPIAAVDAELLPLPPGEEQAMRRHWGEWVVPQAKRDVPIQHDTRKDGDVPLFYGKSFRVQLIIDKELGHEGYRAFLAQAAKQRTESSDQALELLARAKNDVDWRALLGGWVFPGPYTKYKPMDIPGILPE